MAKFRFSIPVIVRIGDLNYGNHVGHQNYFLYYQEARLAYLKQFGFNEGNIDGYAMVVAEAGCKYKHELLHGDVLDIYCRVSALKSKAFIMEYRIERDRTLCATGATTNVCVDPVQGRAVALPERFINLVRAFEGMGD